MAVEIREEEESMVPLLKKSSMNSPGKAPWPLLPHRFLRPLMSHAKARNTRPYTQSINTKFVLGVFDNKRVGLELTMVFQFPITN